MAAIAAASILAKTGRDEALIGFERQFPGYGLARHKGYPTPQHLQALAELGPTPLHRLTYSPVKKCTQGTLCL